MCPTLELNDYSLTRAAENRRVQRGAGETRRGKLYARVMPREVSGCANGQLRNFTAYSLFPRAFTRVQLRARWGKIDL